MPRSGEEVTSSAPNKEGERREYPLEKGNLVQGACKAVAITQRRRSQRRRVVRNAEIGRLGPPQPEVWGSVRKGGPGKETVSW